MRQAVEAYGKGVPDIRNTLEHSLFASFWNATKALRQHLVEKFLQHRDKKRLEKELEFMTPKEREIIAYLLAKKQKVFEVLPDGEQASTLIAKGFVVRTARKPPALHRDITVEIPAHVWDVLSKHQDSFPYQPSKSEAHAWRTSWMAR